MKQPHFQFSVTKEEYQFLTEHQMVPLELQNLCLTALYMIGEERYLILDQDQADDLWEFCMNFIDLNGLTALGDKFYLGVFPLFFSEFERLSSIIIIDQDFTEKIKECPSSRLPKFVLGIEKATILRDLCLQKILEIDNKKDKSFLQTLIDRFYIPNRIA